jgi:hypothetical protein
VCDARQAAVARAEHASCGERIGDHCVVLGVAGETDQRPRALAPVDEQAGLTERRGVARHVGLRFVEQLRQLAHAQLFGGRECQQPEAGRIAQQPIELPA